MFFNIIFSLGIVFLLKSILYLNIDTSEDSTLEFLQAVLLIIATIVYIFIAIKAKSIVFKVTSYGFALLFFSFAIRELDVEKFMLPDIVRFLLGTEGKKYTMVFLWSAWLLSYFLFVKNKINVFISFLKTKEASLLIVSLVLLVSAQIMDKNIFHLQNNLNRYFEEFWELIAYIYILFASLTRLKLTKK